MLGAFDDLKTVPYELLSVPKMEGIYIHATGVHTFFFIQWLFVEFMEPVFTCMPGESYHK